MSRDLYQQQQQQQQQQQLEARDMREADNFEEEDEDDQFQDDYLGETYYVGHRYFTEVADEFVEDDFNLTGLSSIVPFFKEALEMILDLEPEEDSTKVPDVSIVEASAEQLYGLIHQRFIVTRQGLQQMADKYRAGHFGACPRTLCQSTNVVPCGRYDLPGVETVKLYCPSCAYFGTTFPHMLFHVFPDLAYDIPGAIYKPAIYGFKVSEFSRCGPRMQWLRTKKDPTQLDASGRLIKGKDDDDDEEDDIDDDDE
ncbi:casein kinase 2 regulatory subunit [Lunasporangiospora selenospora]|uniref:Casein kinase II subunit beta n=1 Tax=Lunasporangiospora selenospora TaxID=979761 RepID=A0A9P6G2A8_9FUNG|nr:casein kinase 2 regulatory subunit [Lunasporangiospora selenospora]